MAEHMRHLDTLTRFLSTLGHNTGIYDPHESRLLLYQGGDSMTQVIAVYSRDHSSLFAGSTSRTTSTPPLPHPMGKITSE